MAIAQRKRIAHVRRLQDSHWDTPHSLDSHLRGVACRAADFASVFLSRQWGKTVGMLHDIGKATSEWQSYLRRKSGYGIAPGTMTTPQTVEHSIAGAQWAERAFGPAGRFLAYCIAGHHAGLPNWYPDEAGGQSALSYRLSKAQDAAIPTDLTDPIRTLHPGNPPWAFENQGLDLSLWIRMLFSALVDADYLDTEEYMRPEQATLRGDYRDPQELLKRLNMHITALTADAKPSQVNLMRRTVLNDCRTAASLPPGLFSLTVPTGGGKTLSSMAFALKHACTHGLDRVIYVIPYTSIIEQNADVFRTALGDDQVIEHHSSFDDDGTTPESRLATENWDAPVIVTTTVQFFESLFAARPGRCRKLHNIANSVVVLDEAQLLPTEFLQPILNSMELLCRRYRVTFVVATATQPAFEARTGFKGLPTHSVREIISDIPLLYHSLKRVEVEIPGDWNVPAQWSEVSDALIREKQVLCVVSDRTSCRQLYELLPKSAGNYHLSALMCGRHRSETIAEIKAKLKAGDEVRVVSTQLVEAGVDIDFPVVYRALAGLDSIAQAAGRCNREGRMAHLGKVVVFIAPRSAPPGMLRKAAQTTEGLFRTGLENPLDQESFTRFFNDLYGKAHSLDREQIIKLLTPDQQQCAIQFRTAAARFRLIDDTAQVAVLVPYGEGRALIAKLKSTGPAAWLLRKLQRYTVNIYAHELARMSAEGRIIEAWPGGVYALASELDYSKNIGLMVTNDTYEPNDLIQ